LLGFTLLGPLSHYAIGMDAHDFRQVLPFLEQVESGGRLPVKANNHDLGSAVSFLYRCSVALTTSAWGQDSKVHCVSGSDKRSGTAF
jgi:hypothetical protein